MDINYTDKLNKVLQYSKEEAIRLQNDFIGPEHIMLGILRDGDNKACDVLMDGCKIDIPELK